MLTIVQKVKPILDETDDVGAKKHSRRLKTSESL